MEHVSRNGLDASGQSQRVFPEALQGRRCLQARRLRTRWRGVVLDPQELRHQGAAVAIWRISSCHTVTQQTRSNSPATAPGRSGRMPWTSHSPVEVAQWTACSTTRPSWGSGTLLLHRRKLLKSLCCTQFPVSMSCDVMWHVSFCPLTLTTAANWLESEHPKASLVTAGPKANAWWGKGRASHACACIILQLLYHNWQNLSICFTVCGRAQQAA